MRLSYVDEAAEVERILDLMEGRFGAAMRDYSLTGRVSQLRTAGDAFLFKQSSPKKQDGRMAFDELRAARAAGSRWASQSGGDGLSR